MSRRLAPLVVLLVLPLLLGFGEALAQPQLDFAVPSAPAPSQRAASASTKPTLDPERSIERGEPAEVRVLIWLIDVDDLNSAEQSFAASVYYEARWKSPHLAHPGPDPLHRRLTEVWNPRLVIVNQQMAWSSFPDAVDIYPDGEVVLRQKVWGRFSQPLDLRDFPLDRQVLKVQLASAGLLEGQVRLVPLETSSDKSGIASSFSMPDFEVVSWKTGAAPYDPTDGDRGIAGFTMEVEVRRRLPYFITKVILPLCLIVIISWAPFWIDPEQFGTNIGIATTSFLTLVAYLFAINAFLPPVSYITRLDMFILLATLMVFASLMQTIAIATLVKKPSVPVERIDRWSRVIYPAVLVIVLATSFGA